VSGGQPLLESYKGTPANGICALAWNAFDEDAHNVYVTVIRRDLGAVVLDRAP
jgi:hypothetical protein